MVWFTDADVALWAIIISVTWKVVGFGMILFVARIQAIDTEIVEAAMIDGAELLAARRPHHSAAQLPHDPACHADQRHRVDARFRPVLHHDCGRAGGKTFTSVYWMYQNSFIFFKLGYGSALAVILTVIIAFGRLHPDRDDTAEERA